MSEAPQTCDPAELRQSLAQLAPPCLACTSACAHEQSQYIATRIHSSVHNQAASTHAICMQSSIALSQGDLLNSFMSQQRRSRMLNTHQSCQCNRLQSRDVCKMERHVKNAYRACLMQRRTRSFLKAGSRLKPCGSCSLCGSGLSYSGRQCDAPLVKDCANPCNATHH